MMPDGSDHERIQADLPAFAAGRIEGKERSFLEAHLAFCSSCSELLASMRMIHDAFRERGKALLSPHPSGEDVRSYALGEGSADPGIARHVQVCARCDLEARTWNSSDASRSLSTSPRPEPAAFSRSGAAIGLAAGLVLGIGLGVAASLLWPRGGTRPPATAEAVPSPGSAAAPAPAPWSGAARTILLPRALRGAAAPLEVTLGSSERYVSLAVPDFLDASIPDSAHFGFTIRGEDGDVVWAAEMTVAEIRAHLRSAEAVTFVIPVEVIAAGSFEFAVAQAGTREAALVYRVRIRVERSE